MTRLPMYLQDTNTSQIETEALFLNIIVHLFPTLLA